MSAPIRLTRSGPRLLCEGTGGSQGAGGSTQRCSRAVISSPLTSGSRSRKAAPGPSASSSGLSSLLVTAFFPSSNLGFGNRQAAAAVCFAEGAARRLLTCVQLVVALGGTSIFDHVGFKTHRHGGARVTRLIGSVRSFR